MDSFFGIGFPELVMILVLAGIVMGPHRIRHVARTLGKLVGQMQIVSRQFTRQLNAELDAMDADDLKGAVQDVKELQQEMANLRRQFASLPNELMQEGKKVRAEAEETLKPVAATNEQLLQEGRRAARAAEARAGTDEEEQRPEGEASELPPAVPLPTPLDVPDDPEA